MSHLFCILMQSKLWGDETFLMCQVHHQGCSKLNFKSESKQTLLCSWPVFVAEVTLHVCPFSDILPWCHISPWQSHREACSYSWSHSFKTPGTINLSKAEGAHINSCIQSCIYAWPSHVQGCQFGQGVNSARLVKKMVNSRHPITSTCLHFT